MAHLSRLSFAVPVCLALLSGCGSKKAGDPCKPGDECDGLSCLAGTCQQPASKELYQACQVNEQCSSGQCAAGFCAAHCSQFFPKGKYKVGDCVSDSDMTACTVQGVGCCKLASVTNSSSTQDEDSGQCTANP